MKKNLFVLSVLVLGGVSQAKAISLSNPFKGSADKVKSFLKTPCRFVTSKRAFTGSGPAKWGTSKLIQLAGIHTINNAIDRIEGEVNKLHNIININDDVKLLLGTEWNKLLQTGELERPANWLASTLKNTFAACGNTANPDGAACKCLLRSLVHLSCPAEHHLKPSDGKREECKGFIDPYNLQHLKSGALKDYLKNIFALIK